jgi:transposase InsO family protein
MCRVLEVSSSGYYAWRSRPESARSLADQQLLHRIRRLYYDSNEVYGSPRIHQQLSLQGVRVSRKRIARLMRGAALVAKSRRRFRRKGHRGDHYLVGWHRPKVSALRACNQLWVADITYIKKHDRHVYLSAIMDLYSREIVGWHLSRHLGAQIVIKALAKAVQQHNPPSGVVFHSDQGIEYANYALAAVLHNHGFAQSMSRRGNCYDNAHMESFFHSLKTECLHHCHFYDLEQVRAEVFQYIEAFYNTRRCHSSLGYLSPKEYARQHDNHR